MLEDREYMRQPEFGGERWRLGFHLRWTWSLTLVAIYVVVLLAEEICGRYFPRQGIIFNYLALSKAGLAHGYVWQLVTYQFMHAGWVHLLLNSWAIVVFGSELEQLLGGRRYLAVLFASGIVGGVFQVLTALAWPTVFDGTVVGASACAFGLVAAFATIFPERELTMLIFFVIPVRMRAKTLLLVSLVVALLGIFFPWDNVANAAHLGGIVMGWIYVKYILRSPVLLGVEEAAPATWDAPPPAPRQRDAAPEGADGGDVDAVLDKISARGINSLTARERAVLEAARKRMVQR